MSKKIILLTLLGLSLAAWACSPGEPAMPQWEVALERIPIIGPDTLIMGEELDDDNIFTDPDGVFHIQFDGQQEIGIASQLKLDAVSPAPFDGEIGTFDVSGNTGQGVNINIFLAFPLLTTGTGAIPAATISVPAKSLTLNNFSSVTFESGSIIIEVNNNLDFDLGTPLNISLFDVSNSTTVDNVSFTSEIPSGGSSQLSFNLAGKTMSNNLQVIVTGSENGTGGSSVLIDGTESFTVNVSMENLKATSATAQIPNQQFPITDAVNINSNTITVESAVVKDGQLNLDFSSDFSFPVQLDLTLPQVLNSSNQTVTKTISISAFGNTNSSIDLSNTTLNLNGGDLQFDIDVTALTNPSGLTTVNSSDKITTSVNTTAINFSSVTADIDMGVDFPSFEQDVVDFDFDIPDINFDDIVFTMVFEDNPVDMSIEMNMYGAKDGETPINADYAFDITGGITNTVEIPKTSVLVNGTPAGSGSGLIDLINLMPNEISFSGTALIDDDNATLTSNPVGINYSVDVPFIFSLPDGAKLDGDPEELDLDDDVRKKLRENFKSSSIDITLANGTPIGGNITFRTTDAAGFSTPESQWPVLTSIVFTAATTDVDGDVILPILDQELTIGLTEQQMQQLSNSDYLYWEINLDTVAKGKLKATDTIMIKAGYITGRLLVNEDLFDSDGNK